jgi:hypothetical protein
LVLISLQLDAGPRRTSSPFLAKAERLLRTLAPTVLRGRQIAAQMINTGFELALDSREDFVEDLHHGVIVREHVGGERGDAVLSRDLRHVTQEKTPDALALKPVEISAYNPTHLH